MKKLIVWLFALFVAARAVDVPIYSSSKKKVFTQTLTRENTDTFYMSVLLGSNEQGKVNSTFIIDISEHHTLSSSTFSSKYGCEHQYYDEQQSTTAVNMSSGLV